MLGDPWPEEPDDPFPEYRTPFPEYAEPRPEAGAPVATHRRVERDGTASPVETAVQDGFVGLLAVFRVGILALALGPMLVAFRGADPFGHAITAVGVVSCTYGFHRYLLYRRALETDRRRG